MDVHLTTSEFEIGASGVPDEPSIGSVSTPPLIWEHVDFQFGSTRFDANPDSLVEHLGFRRAVAHAVERDSLTGPTVIAPVDSIIELYLPAADTNVWSDLYPHDPEQASALVAELFADMGREPAAGPPTLRYTTSTADSTIAIGDGVVTQLNTAGIAAEAEYGDFFSDAFPARRWEFGAWRWVGGNSEIGLRPSHPIRPSPQRR